MKPIAYNVYVLMMFLAYVMRRAGTFSIEDKVRMIEFLSYMALNPNRVVNDQNSSSSKSLTVMSEAAARVVTTPVAASAYIGSSTC